MRPGFVCLSIRFNTIIIYSRRVPHGCMISSPFQFSSCWTNGPGLHAAHVRGLDHISTEHSIIIPLGYHGVRIRRPRRICKLESVFCPCVIGTFSSPFSSLRYSRFPVSISSIAHICLVFILRLSNLVLSLEKFLGFRISSLFLANKLDLFVSLLRR